MFVLKFNSSRIKQETYSYFKWLAKLLKMINSTTSKIYLTPYSTHLTLHQLKLFRILHMFEYLIIKFDHNVTKNLRNEAFN